MDVRLLGPFELFLDDSAQHLPGRGERALLALLSLSAPHVVASGTLIEQLWGLDELPEDPHNALQIRVSKLRKALSAGGSDLVQRQGAGYRLAVDPADVDAHRFAEFVETARRTGDPGQAVLIYDKALSLWRAEPLVDFAGEAWTLVESGRLTELRLAAVAERAERMLTLGRYEQLVSDLEPIVANAPTRERLVGQLMTALFNAGRQVEALEVFARTRRMLADELGLDPSRELRQVMEQILRQDPAITPAVATRSPVGSPGGGSAAGNLPLRATSFVGRGVDLNRTQVHLRKAKLVTLAGPGGAGKTALAIEAARAAVSEFPDGSWLVQLAAVSEQEGITHAVAEALGLSIAGGTASRRPRDVLVSQLASRNLLLVLDNCEHLIEPVASLVETVLARCPAVTVMATSREALAVPGEVQLPVSPLAVPAPDTAAQDVPRFPAAELFLDRAAAVAPDLAFDGERLLAVALICQRLDGIPLALELAAARLTSFGPLELADRVLDRFAVLTTGSRTAEARQRTLRNTVDWSHDLLSPPERALFRRLAVFRGGWDLGAVEAVAPGPELPSGDVLDLLDRLVRQSMVVADHTTAHTRYRMLETIRQYAQLKLDDSGEADDLRDAHAAYFLGLGEQAESGLRGSTQDRWIELLTADHANLRSSLSWLTEAEGKVDSALKLAGSLGLYWHMGRHLEGRETLRRVMALPGGSPEARARAMQAVSLVERPRACLVHPSEQCAAAASESLQIFEQVGDKKRAAFSRLLLSVEGVGGGARVDAGALLERADREFAELHDDWGQAVAAFVRMETLTKHGDMARSREAAVDATARFRALGDGWGLSAVLYHSGWGLSRFGRNAEAVPVLEEAIDVANRAGVYNTAQWATADLGLALLALGRIQEAAECFARAGTSPDRFGDEAGGALATYGEAVLAHAEGQHGRARLLFERAHEGFQRMGVHLATGLALSGMADCDERSGDIASARAEYQQLVELGESSGEAGLMAAGLEGMARAAVADSEAAQAAELLGRAAWLRKTQERPATPQEEAAVEAAVDSALSSLGKKAYAAAAKRGAQVGLGETT